MLLKQEIERTVCCIAAYDRLSIVVFGDAKFGAKEDLVTLSRILEPRSQKVFIVGVCTISY